VSRVDIKLNRTEYIFLESILNENEKKIELDKLKELGLFEAEYLSLDNKLNRLDLYFGELKKDNISVVDLTTGTKIISSQNKKTIRTKEILKYIFHILF
jgi:hypothetical protein